MAFKIDSHYRRHQAGHRRRAAGAIAVALGVTALAGCSSANGSGASSDITPPYGGNPTHTRSATPSGRASGAQTLVVKHAPNGAGYLTDSVGRTLYLFEADSKGKSNCNGPCAVQWPPLTGSVTPGKGVTGAMRAFNRSDGGKQAVINGHPLYYYVVDMAPGDTRGQGVNAFGGLWYVVSPSGNPVKSLK